MTPDQYAQAVREALADHPDREELLEDLDDHLAEIATESDLPLEERLGPPAAYAEEIVAAYDGRPQSSRPRRRPLAGALTWLRAQAVYREAAAFLPELRPGWWVLRGYVLAMFVSSFLGYPRLAPESLVDVLLVIGAVLGSIWYGRRASGQALRWVTAVVNTLIGIVILGGMTVASEWNRRVDDPPSSSYAPERIAMGSVSALDEGIYNIKPYAKDGTPLTDVLLYDQDGKPIVTEPGRWGYRVDRACGEPVLNRFPLPLVEENPEVQVDENGNAIAPTATAAPCASPSPVTAMPTPSESKPAPSASKPAESVPSASKPAEAAPSEGKPAKPTPSESKPAESVPSESKPADPTPKPTKSR
ncbi:hypothetical protein [Nonomuraea typhae]|uniref:Uncharacterized protein n=1 Tax=Nonomuraea typhae TaxID=2603600 RepID=A0ABW7YXM4_9ACTN